MLLFSPIYFTVVKAILLHDPHHCHEELLVLQKELMAKICESTDFVTSPSLMFFFFLFINQILVCIYKYFEKKKEDAGSVHNFLVFFSHEETKKQLAWFFGGLEFEIHIAFFRILEGEQEDGSRSGAEMKQHCDMNETEEYPILEIISFLFFSRFFFSIRKMFHSLVFWLTRYTRARLHHCFLFFKINCNRNDFSSF